MTSVQRAKRTLARLSELEVFGTSIGRVFNQRVPSRGLRIDTRELAPSIKSQLLFRTYESAEIRAVQRHLRPDLEVIELGASVGVLSCHIRRTLEPRRHLYCVEANEFAAKMIPVNLELNGLNHNVVVFHAAIAYGSGHGQFQPGETTISGRVTEGLPSASVSVPTVTLSTLIRDFSIGEYALVCDIEGSEWEMIAEEISAFRDCAQIIIELHSAVRSGKPCNADDFIGMLADTCNFHLKSRCGGVYVFDRC